MGFKTDDMAREWSRAGADDGRRRKSIRTWYAGASFYSYSTEIARRLQGGMFAWITTRTYSVSTSRHTHDAMCAASRAGARLVFAPECPSKREIEEMINRQIAFCDLLEEDVPEAVREPPKALFAALLEIKDAMPDEFEPLIAQRIFGRICDRYKVHTAPIVICDKPEWTGTEIQIPAERPARQMWFTLAHAFAHSLDGNGSRHGIFVRQTDEKDRGHGILFNKRMKKIAGMIVKDYSRIQKENARALKAGGKPGPCERAECPAPSNVERSPLAGASTVTEPAEVVL